MSRTPHSVMIADIGYGNCKTILLTQAPEGIVERRWMIPSVVVQTRENLSSLGSSNIRKIQVGGTDIYFGPDILDELGGTQSGMRGAGSHYFESSTYRNLVIANLCESGLAVIDELVLTLPLDYYETAAKELKALRGQYEWQENGIFKTTTVVNVSVQPQALGALIHYRVLNANVGFEKSTRAVLDFGGGTLNFLVAQGYAGKKLRSGHVDYGVRSMWEDMAKEISRQIQASGRVAKFENVALIENAARSGRDYVSTAFGDFEMASLLKQNHSRLVEKVTEAARKMGDVSDILEIVLCGGGAAYIEPAVREVFPVQKIVCLPEPFFANANGFAMLSRKQMAGRELAHAE